MCVGVRRRQTHRTRRDRCDGFEDARSLSLSLGLSHTRLLLLSSSVLFDSNSKFQPLSFGFFFLVSKNTETPGSSLTVPHKSTVCGRRHCRKLSHTNARNALHTTRAVFCQNCLPAPPPPKTACVCVFDELPSRVYLFLLPRFRTAVGPVVHSAFADREKTKQTKERAVSIPRDRVPYSSRRVQPPTDG